MIEAVLYRQVFERKKPGGFLCLKRVSCIWGRGLSYDSSLQRADRIVKRKTI